MHRPESSFGGVKSDVRPKRSWRSSPNWWGLAVHGGSIDGSAESDGRVDQFEIAESVSRSIRAFHIS